MNRHGMAAADIDTPYWQATDAAILQMWRDNYKRLGGVAAEEKIARVLGMDEEDVHRRLRIMGRVF